MGSYDLIINYCIKDTERLFKSREGFFTLTHSYFNKSVHTSYDLRIQRLQTRYS